MSDDGGLSYVNPATGMLIPRLDSLTRETCWACKRGGDSHRCGGCGLVLVALEIARYHKTRVLRCGGCLVGLHCG